PLILILALAEAMLIGHGDLEQGASHFAISALALPIALIGTRPRPLSWLVGLSVLILPGISAVWTTRRPGTGRTLRWLARFVLLPGVLVAVSAAAFLQVLPLADVFEDGHALLPASEYLRGERPYRDIVPGHGLLSDGALAVAELKLFGDDYRGLYRGEKAAGALFWPAFYALGAAGTRLPARPVLAI